MFFLDLCILLMLWPRRNININKITQDSASFVQYQIQLKNPTIVCTRCIAAGTNDSWVLRLFNRT